MKKALVIGFGLSGKAAAKFLVAHGYEVLTVDKDPKKKGDHPFKTEDEEIDVKGFDLAILSPGIPYTHPLVKKVVQAGIELIGEVELACRYIKQPMIGITGTNGKTTVTLLITHVLKACGIEAHALGNVGVPITSSPVQSGVIVLELSSYQLESLQTKCLDQAVILNITPDHLDRYHTMDNYAGAKFMIQNILKESGKLLVEEAALDAFGHHLKVKAETYPRASTHDLENESAALWVVKQYGITENQFRKALSTFKKPHHRIEYVDDIQGVRFIDDSKGTNIDAVLRAIDTIETPIVLITGGVDKGYPYTPWIEPFKKKVKKIIAIGEAAPKIRSDLMEAYQVEIVKTLEEATENAFQIASKGDTVLLSPGCSSLDMFKDYAHRGEVFQKTVRGIKEKVL